MSRSEPIVEQVPALTLLGYNLLDLCQEVVGCDELSQVHIGVCCLDELSKLTAWLYKGGDFAGRSMFTRIVDSLPNVIGKHVMARFGFLSRHLKRD